MFIRIMVIVGFAALVLAFIMLAHISRTVTPPLSAKPLGTSTLSHGGPSVAPPSKELPDHPDDGTREQDSLGDAK
jgi:hypothetical protein